MCSKGLSLVVEEKMWLVGRVAGLVKRHASSVCVGVMFVGLREPSFSLRMMCVTGSSLC